jgi:hypothetical protein
MVPGVPMRAHELDMPMKSNSLSSVRTLAVLASVAGVGGLTTVAAADPPILPRHLSGLLNDYSPAHVNGAPVKGAPYEMRGRWSLEVQRYTGTATFSAAVNMETTDAGTVSQDDPTTRGAHTHHITMTGTLKTDSADLSTCPANDPANPPVTWRFVVSGQAQITGNGNQAPFQVKSGPSNLQVCIGGGTDGTLEYSNVTLVFGAPASNHFGPQPIHGVVSRCGWAEEPASGECTLSW